MSEIEAIAHPKKVGIRAIAILISYPLNLLEFIYQFQFVPVQSTIHPQNQVYE
ncbi:MAG: hypothetical protein WBB28_02715 [Crinalium sp.]